MQNTGVSASDPSRNPIRYSQKAETAKAADQKYDRNPEGLTCAGRDVQEQRLSDQNDQQQCQDHQYPFQKYAVHRG